MRKAGNRRRQVVIGGIFLTVYLTTTGMAECNSILEVTACAAGMEAAEETETKQEQTLERAGEYEQEKTGEESMEEADGNKPERTEKENKAYLGIDNVHTYKNMNASFSKGYVPVTEGDVVHLAVPFTASEELKDHTMTVSLDLGENAPFVYASYEKNVEKNQFSFGEEMVEAYLYLCDIQLEKERVNGTYPVIVRAWGYTQDGEKTELESRIFISVTDGTNPEEKQEEEKTEKDATDEYEDTEGAQQETGIFSDTDDVSAGMGSMAAEEKEQEITRQPKLILESGSLWEIRLKAGEKKEFTAAFKNKSKRESIYNLKVTTKPSEDSVFFKNSSFYFESVAPQETIQISTEAGASPVAEQKTLPVEFIFEYEDEKGTACTGTEQMMLQIYQPVQIAVEGFDLPAQVYSLENIDAGLQIQNRGKAPVYNVQVKLEGKGLFPTGTIFAGNMEAGQTAEGKFQIYVGNKKMKTSGEEGEGTDKERYGTVSGKLILTYEDIYGETYRQEQEFTTVIRKPQLTEIKVKEEKKETNQWWAGIFTLLLLLTAGTVGGMGRKLKKSRNQLADLLEERGKQDET